MRLHLMALGALLLASWSSVGLAAGLGGSFHLGESERLFYPSEARDWREAQTKALVTRIWYPVDANVAETAHDIGSPDHPIFAGHPAAIDAPLSMAQTKFPLLLLSHGTGGTADTLDWLGAALARAGYIVVAVNHPGNNALEPLTRAGFMLWWERATDLSDALDGVLADPVLGPHIDRGRIGAVGFSLGGYTVLEVAGARTRLRAFEDFCRSASADATCHPVEADALKGAKPPAAVLSPEMVASLARSGASFCDRRIKAVFAIAPALGEAFDGTSFAGVDVPVAMIGGAADVTVPVATNIQRISKFLPNASVTLLPGAGHYTFLDDCLPDAAGRLALLCRDNPGVNRDAIHAQTTERMTTFFAKTLVNGGPSQRPGRAP